MAGALGFAAMGIGVGFAHADPKPNPPVPGQVKKDPALGFTPNPLDGVPPGHWDDPAYFGIPTTWLPPNYWGPPLRVVFNPNWTAWGVWVNDGLFVPLPR